VTDVIGDGYGSTRESGTRLSSLGITLKAGQVVTTGTCMTPLEVEPGHRVEADFGPLGRVGLMIRVDK